MNTALASVHPARATGSLSTDGAGDPGTASFAGNCRSKRLLSPVSLFVLMALGLCVAFPGYALDLVAFTGIILVSSAAAFRALRRVRHLPGWLRHAKITDRTLRPSHRGQGVY